MRVRLTKEDIESLIGLWKTFPKDKRWGNNAPPEFMMRMKEIAGQDVVGKEIEVEGQSTLYTFSDDGSMTMRVKRKAALPESRRKKNG